MLTGCVAHGLMILALSIAPASVLQPISYTSLPWALAFGYFIFDELIDPIVAGGGADHRRGGARW